MARRSLVENKDLPWAVQWELVRSAYFRKHGNHEMADHFEDLAGWFQVKLDRLLEAHIEPESNNSEADA